MQVAFDAAERARCQVTMVGDMTRTNVDRDDLIARLRELIEALESRVPHFEREGEVLITRDAAALKQKALERIAELAPSAA